MQWLIIALIVTFVYFVYFRKPHTKGQKNTRHDEISDVMLECERCGVFTSEKEAIIVDGCFYCSKECAQVK
ncbi:MAG: PP0621 family protein [Wolinella sp.]